MTDERHDITAQRRDPTSDGSLNPPDVALEDQAVELAGERPRGEQGAVIGEDNIADLGHMTDTEVDQGQLEAGVSDDPPGEPVAENLEMLTELELRAGETDDANVAAEEGLAYVPPVDPPVVPDPDDPQGARVAAGFGLSSLAEPFDEDHRGDALADEDEMSARVREAMWADSSTSMWADHVAIGTRGGVVALRGVVEDLQDSDNLLAVASYVEGVEEVIDELTVRALE